MTEEGNLNESTENAENQTSEQSSEGPAECENSEHESKMEVDAPSSTGSGNSPIASADNIAVKSVGRVKVKLRTSKAPEPDETSREDIDKSSSQVGSEKPAVPAEKKEELVPHLPGREPVFFNVYRKTKGIKIKSSKAVDGSGSVTEKSADAVKAQYLKRIQKRRMRILKAVRKSQKVHQFLCLKRRRRLTKIHDTINKTWRILLQYAQINLSNLLLFLKARIVPSVCWCHTALGDQEDYEDGCC